MKATDVMLVFLMPVVWGQNYQMNKELELLSQRVGGRMAACTRART